MRWRKGCLCGCLRPDECRYKEDKPEVVHHVHHVIHLYERPPTVVTAEVVGEVLEIEGVEDE